MYAIMLMTVLQVTCIILFSIFVCIYGQCEIRGLCAYGGENSIGVSWSCQQPHNKFQVTYKLMNTCSDYNGSDAPPFDLKTSNWIRHTMFVLYKDFDKIYVNSTYQFTVQSRIQQEGQYVFGTNKTVNYTTSADIYLSASINSRDRDSYIKAYWSPFFDQCVSNGPTKYDYQLFRSDGYIAHSGATNNTAITIIDLECETRYRIKVAYRTEHGTGPDFWASAGSTKLYDPLEPTVKCSASDETSLSFTWDEYQPCNTRNDIEATYEYELKEDYWLPSLYSGSTNDTIVSFTDLKPDQEYTMTLQLHIKSSSGSTRDSYYVYVYAKTGSIKKSNKVLFRVLLTVGVSLVIAILVGVSLVILIVLLNKVNTRKTKSYKPLTADEFDMDSYNEIK